MTVSSSDPTSGADAAINRVLAAEQAAKREIAECRRKALVILRQARSNSRAVANRTDRRINRIHALSDATINRSLEDIAIEARMLSDTPEMTNTLSDKLDGAIARLIEEILE